MRTRRALIAALALLNALTPALPARSADVWPSPSVPPQRWPGLMWPGIESGAPATPSARHCHRAPERFEVAAGAGQPGAIALARPAPALAMKAPPLMSAPPPMPIAPPAPAGARAEPPVREIAAVPAPAAKPAAPSVLAPQALADRRPADERVSAGVIDDNADFGEYLAYRQRKAELARSLRPRDVSERYPLVVTDGEGRPVPDAEVRVVAEGRELPLWARTDAQGRAWLHPAAVGVTARFMEVQVRQGKARSSAILQRGQKDRLQVVLDGATPSRPQLDIAFLVDATGSMGDEIDKLKRSMRAVADEISRLPSQPSVCYALVAYRDRGDDFFVRGADFTDDLAAFQAQLARIEANGGGDYPEALNEALHTAVHRLSWRGAGTARMLLLVADAPPHLDYGQPPLAPQYDHDAVAALARGIKLFAVGASGLQPDGEYIFRQAAQFTGGRFVFLTYANAQDPSSGPGRETVHDVSNYSVETLDRLVVRLVREEIAGWSKG